MASPVEFDTASAPRRAASSVWADALGVVRTVLAPVASLKLTCALFVAAALLIFFGTLAQKTLGLWTVVDSYFWSWVVWVDVQPMLEFGKIFLGLPPDAATTTKFPFPAGKLIGGVMFVNLLAAHFVQFINLVTGVGKQVSRGKGADDVAILLLKKSGVYVLHFGLLLLFVGEFVTREYQVEQRMVIEPGQSAGYAFDLRHYELAFTSPAGPDADAVTVVPGGILQAAAGTGKPVTNDKLPVAIDVLQYMPNSEGAKPKAGEDPPANPATAGFGKGSPVVPIPEVSGVDTSERVNLPSAYVRFTEPATGKELGTYLVTLLSDRTQPVTVGTTTYEILFRHARYYKPFTLKLLQFHADKYVGTSTPRNYSSDLHLLDPEYGQDRDVTIRMNEPLRHRGETFYQSGFTPDEKGTILQVVDNPGWRLPYVSCVLVTLGMLLHFGIFLVQFLIRNFLSGRPAGAAPRRPEVVAAVPTQRIGLATVLVPVAAVAFAVLYLVVATAAPGRTKGQLDLRAAARIPVVDGGRVKPLDTVARVDLRLVTYKEDFKDANGVTQPAIKWLLDTASGDPTHPGPAGEYKIFRVENDQVRDLLKLPKREGMRYSFEEIRPRLEQFAAAAEKAENRPEKDRDVYEVQLLEVGRHLKIYTNVLRGQSPLLLPPADGQPWRAPESVAESALDRARVTVRARIADRGWPTDLEGMTREQKEQLADLFGEAMAAETGKDPAYAAWDALLAAYRSGDQAKLDAAVAAFRAEGDKAVSPADLTRVRLETFLNEAALYYHCTVMYGVAWFLTVVGWLALLASPAAGAGLRRAAFWWLLVTFLVHSATLLARMYLMDRPLVFVTNLHSSAVFIGWAAAAVCLAVEVLYPIGVGNLIAASIGYGTAIVAHHLAATGDTLEMMQAVLDTNFWLATHVTTVTFGYAATYVAAAVGLVYVALSVLPQQLLLKQQVSLGAGPDARRMELGRVVGQILYAIVCFATLLSFVGTVLGGIWADQSWGRFWGWDPKENGAVLIVLWNALILHARWAGLVKDRGMAVLSLVGAMVTTWSWFGTNQLGVGLHNYGFNKTLAYGCTAAWGTLAVLAVAGCLPWQWAWGPPAPPRPPATPPRARSGRA